MTTLPVWLVALLLPFAMFCLAVLIWAILPRRAPGSARRNADIERQIATLRRHADHSVATRPRVRAHSTAGALPKKPCGGGQCRKRIDCADPHCPGQAEALLASQAASHPH